MPGTPDPLSFHGEFLGEFVDEAITGPFPEFQFTVIFRPETKLAPLVLNASEIETINDTAGHAIYKVWAGGGHARRVIGLFNAAELIGIVRGGGHLMQAAS